MYIVDLSIYFHDKRDYFATIGTFTLVVKIHDVNNKKFAMEILPIFSRKIDLCSLK